MQEFIEKIANSFLEFFNGLNTGKKFALVGVFAGIIGIIIAITMWATKTRFKTFYADLNREDSKKIAILLEESKIPYQTSEDGKKISIPEDMVEIWRLKLATKGVTPSGSFGYEVFDKNTFGQTSFVQRVNRQRALEGELVRTIKYINGVKRARVHLSLPESSPFVIEKRPPSASVVIELEDGVSLTPEEIKGIGHLVSSSVDAMRPENVVILDHQGKKLSENIGDPMTAYTANRIALEAKESRRLEAKVEELLSRAVGAGKVIAKVSVALDFTEKVATETQFDGENAAVLSEVNNTANNKGVRPSPQGIPGARSNLPGEQPQPGIPETRNDVNKSLTTKNYNIPSKVIKSKTPTAGIKSITASVMIDGRQVPQKDAKGAVVKGEDGRVVLEYQPWTAAELENFKELIGPSIGIDSRRGDKIVIKNMEFAKEDLAQVESIMRERENRELLRNLVKYLSIGITISLFFFLVVRPFIQWITDNTVETVEDFLPKTLEELEKVQANQKLPGLEDALPQMEEKLNPEKIEGNMLREKIISLVENNPAKAAQVVQDMIHSAESNKEIA